MCVCIVVVLLSLSLSQRNVLCKNQRPGCVAVSCVTNSTCTLVTAQAMHACKACGKISLSNAKEHSLLQGKVYTTLFEVVLDEHRLESPIMATHVHSFLPSEPSYV